MNKTTGVIWMATSATAFGFMAYLASVAQAGGASTETMLLIRFVIASLVVFLYVFSTNRAALAAIPGKTRAQLFAMGSILYLLQSLCFFHALHYTKAAMVSLLLYLYPAFVAIGAFLVFKERMSRVKVGALMLAMIGAAMAIGPATGGDSRGIYLAVGSALAYSTYILIGTKVLEGIDGLAAGTFVFSGVAVSYAILAFSLGIQPPHGAAAWSASVALGLVSIVAMGGFLVGLKVLGPVNSSTISALEPIITAFLGFALMGQALTGLQLLGGIVILGAVIWLVRSK
jgi:drug/metabolite transporter (DMT)-like permease